MNIKDYPELVKNGRWGVILMLNHNDPQTISVSVETEKNGKEYMQDIFDVLVKTYSSIKIIKSYQITMEKNGYADNTGYKSIIHDNFAIIPFGDEIQITCIDKADLDIVLETVMPFRKKENKEKFFMNFIVISSNGYSTIRKRIDRVDVDTDLYYEGLDYNKLKNSLKSDKSGLVLLSSPPGSGKTFLIKKLNQDIKKDFIILDPSIIHDMGSPKMTNFLINNLDNKILILEDGENILKDRAMVNNNFASTLLNMSDGIIGDVLKSKILITYNNGDHIDDAFKRSGRLLYHGQLQELPSSKVKAIAKKLDKNIDQAMVLADIFNSEDNNKEEKRKIGF